MELDYPLEYSGGLLIADELIKGLYVHMGLQKPWKYEKVIELIFEEGVLEDEIDRSERMEDLRNRFINPDGEDSKPMGYKSISEYVGESFERSYDLADEDTLWRA